MCNRNSIYFLLLVLFFSINTSAQHWSQVYKGVASDRAKGDRFGTSVSISGNNAIVGAPFNQTDINVENSLMAEGAAYFYESVNGNWSFVQKITDPKRQGFNYFGNAVSISGNYCIVGASQNDYDENGENKSDAAGAVYIYEKSGGGTWNLAQKLVASDRGNTQLFGSSVSIQGNWAIAGAIYNYSDENGENVISKAGAAYIFKREGDGNWVEKQKIVASDRAMLNNFGFSVDLSENFLIVGANGNATDVNGTNEISKAGAAYIFKKEGETWNEIQKIVISDRAENDGVGKDVSISENTAVLSTVYNTTDENGENPLETAGAAYIFENKNGSIWEQTQKIVPLDRQRGDLFGQSFSVHNNVIAIGADRHSYDENGENKISSAGAVYIFEKNENSKWIQKQKIISSDRISGDNFGYSVSLTDNFIASGAYFSDYDSEGLNNLSQAGSFYVFKTIPLKINNLQTNYLSAFPNPTSGKIEINFNKTIESGKIEVINSTGTSVSDFRIENASKKNITIKTAPGLYYIKITSDNKTPKTLKIIKQ